ncbi:MAG: sulfate ABC transporter substrate-binding protein [Myxococcota bacterium]
MSAVLFAFACSEPAPTADPATPVERRLVVAGYTTPREAYETALFPAFAQYWAEKTGETVTFEATWQGSGAQARAVREGLEADLVALSLDPDVAVLEEAGLVKRDWRAGPEHGIVTRSLAVLAVRPGNPKGIRGWADLTRADVEVLTPNVRTSGGAMWNVLALVGAATRGKVDGVGTDPAAATALLAQVLARVEVMDKGARESIVSFEKGVGDVAITYENEVLVARKSGVAMDYVVPSSTISIENPLVVVDSWADKHGTTELADAFVAFCHTPEAQRAYAEYGLRPVVGTVDLPNPEDLFTVADLGGWAAVKADVFAQGGLYDRATEAAR